MNCIKISIFVIVFCTFYSCKKDSNTNATPYSIRLADDPGPYQAVNLDLQSIEITGKDGSLVTLNSNPKLFNLLNFTNGLDTLIATADLKTSSVEQIRLILGSKNTIKVNNMLYPLSTPSADQTGLKLKVHQELQPGIAYAVLLDFDASKSIVELGNGQFKLKPVIRAIEVAVSGSIRGSIMPVGTLASVIATSNGISYSTMVSSTGNFLLKGIPPGNYSINITPATPILPKTISNIVVNLGTAADLGVIQL